MANPSEKFKQILVYTHFLVRRPFNYLRSLRESINIKINAFIAFKLKPIFSRRNTFFNAHFLLLGLFAKADGAINNEESNLIWDYVKHKLKLDGKEQTKAMRIFFNAGHKAENFTETSQLISRMTAGNVELLSPIFEVLSELAVADGALCKQEEHYLTEAMHIFKMERYEGSSHKNPYTILGCHPDDNVDKIKKTYKRKIAELHPDRLATLGLPKEFINFSTVRFHEIQRAYEIIKAKRQIR
ncbi:MAG: TerB family tellurite resistance protein [Spirochaetaceae bacterium]|nr:TerB family tellurite resistance protein [Spirochaetaceae bacterium]